MLLSRVLDKVIRRFSITLATFANGLRILFGAIVRSARKDISKCSFAVSSIRISLKEERVRPGGLGRIRLGWPGFRNTERKAEIKVIKKIINNKITHKK